MDGLAGLRPEFLALAGTVVLGLLHIMAIGRYSAARHGLTWSLGPRDEPLVPLIGTGGRLQRAFQNYLETYPFFLAALLAVGLAGRLGTLSAWGAEAYLAARILYIPAYLSGMPGLRSLVWAVGFFAIFAILAALLYS